MHFFNLFHIYVFEFYSIGCFVIFASIFWLKYVEIVLTSLVHIHHLQFRSPKNHVKKRCQVQHQISGLMRAKLVSCLENSQLHQYRMVLNMQHIYTRKHVIVSDVPVMVPNLPRCRSTRELYVSESALQQLDDFLKENGFENLGIQPVFFHMFIIFYHLSMF